MTGPEKIYADLTSGNVTTLNTLEQDLAKVMGKLSTAIQDIRLAEDVPNWDSPSARTEFNMRAWATRSMAQVGFTRVNRAKLALQRAAADYEATKESATEIIAAWRRAKREITSPALLLYARQHTFMQLYGLSKEYAGRLDTARDYFETEDLTDFQRKLIKNGMVRSMRFDLSDPTDMGPTIPNTQATGDDDLGLTPQGLGYDPDSGNLLQTSYNSDGQAVLSLVDPDTGELVNSVNLGAPQNGAPPDHAGGVSVHNGRLFVSSSSPAEIYSYKMSDVLNATPGDTVPIQGEPQSMKAGAYSTVYNGTLYVGTFTEDKDQKGELFTYTWDEQSEEWVNPQGPFETPPQSQGVSIMDDYMFFSSSYGRGVDSTLHAYDRNTGQPLGPENLPNMSEGVAALPHGLVTTYESGSSKYDETNPVTPFDDMWVSTNMTVTPYSEFGLQGGIEVEPPTLGEASKSFRRAEAALDKQETVIAGLSLPDSALGNVAAATTFATKLNTHLDTTSTWLDEGRISADLTATGLVDAAENYERTDGSAVDNLRRFIGRLG